MKIKKKKIANGCLFSQLKEGDVFVNGIGLIHIKVKGKNTNALSLEGSDLYRNFDDSACVYPVIKMNVIY